MSANQARHTWASRLVAASLILGAMLGGCASPVSELKAYEPVSQADELKAYRSVLRQPERLSPAPPPAPPPTGAYRWQDPKANFAQYDKVLLTRIFVTLDDKAEYTSIDPVTQAKLTEYFRQAIVKALQPKYPVVTQRGPGVLVVRITLVDLVPVNVAEDLAYQAAPFGAGLAAELAEGPVMGEGFGSAPFLGRTGVVAQFFDGQTNQLVAEYADTQFGKQFVANFSKGITAGVEQGWDQYWKGVKSWSYAEEAFTGWARSFRQWMDRVHGA